MRGEIHIAKLRRKNERRPVFIGIRTVGEEDILPYPFVVAQL